MEDNAFPTSKGNQQRDFCYVDDVIDGILLASNRYEAIGEAINIGSGSPITIKEMIQKVQCLVGSGTPLFGEFPDRKGENLHFMQISIKQREY